MTEMVGKEMPAKEMAVKEVVVKEIVVKVAGGMRCSQRIRSGMRVYHRLLCRSYRSRGRERFQIQPNACKSS